MSKLNLLLGFEKAVFRIENFKANSFLVALYIFFLISLRDVLEQLFFEKYYSIFQLIHHFFFYFLMLIIGILIISFMGKTEIIRTTLIVSAGFILIIAPPLIDRLVFLRNFPYDYILPREFIKNACTFFIFTPKAGKGIFVEIAAILILASFYVFIKTRSVLRAVLTGFILYLLVALSVTPRLYLPIPPLTNPLVRQFKHIIYFSFYLAMSIILGVLFLYRINKALPKAILKELSSFRTLHFILMILVGVYFNKNINFFRFPDFLFVLTSIVLMVILWLSTVIINSVYDLPIDRISNPKRPLVKGDIIPTLYFNLGLVLSLIALVMSVVLGAVPFALTLVALLSSFAYSMPPLRLRKRLFSTLFIGWGSSLSFLIGYFNHTLLSNLSINNEVLFIAFLIFVALSVGPLTKDIKDYQGDLQHGVRTLFTVYGIEKGSKIVSILLGLSLLIPLLLFHKIGDLIFFGLASVFITLLFYLRRRLIISYAGYGLVFSYCALRILGII